MSEHPIIPDKLLKEDISGQYIYSGSSMHPQFKPGQLLYVRPVMHDIAVGDVIVFTNQNKTTNTVHRVIKVDHNQFYTRGDNNPFDDPGPVYPKDILGVVVWANQDGSIKPVQGGKKGLRQLQRQKRRNQISTLLIRLFSPLYQIIKKSRVIPKLWHPAIKIIHIKTKNGVLLKYTYRNQTVAQWDSVSKRFTYQHPYDLIIKPPEDSNLQGG